MKKVFLSLLILVTIGACSSPNPDFIALEDALMQPGVVVIGAGLHDTVFVQIPASDKIMSIAAQNKTTVFWSGLKNGSIVDKITPNTCMIDAKVDYIGNCPYRLYCGGAVELMIAMAVNTAYAVEICK